MKGYYLFAALGPDNLGPQSGVERKVRAQAEVLKKYFDVSLKILPPPEYSGTLGERIYRRLPWTPGWRKWIYDGEFNDSDFLYIRQVNHDASFVKYLRAIKHQNAGLKIIYEVPTFCEMAYGKITFSNMMFHAKERFFCKIAAKYMDRIVTFYGEPSIWGVKCFTLQNGFDFSSIDCPVRDETYDQIHLVSVASNAVWHGYDRAIEGIHEYYQHDGEENIVYHIVGNVLPEYERMVKDYHLEKHVILHGFLSGEELKRIYKISMIAIDVLGGHRKNYPISSSLKSREYAAYGLPIITSSPIDYLPADYAYQMCVPYDDSPLNIADVVRFYQRITDRKSCNEIGKEIRDYAESTCSMDSTMMPVIRWLQGVETD